LECSGNATSTEDPFGSGRLATHLRRSALTHDTIMSHDDPMNVSNDTYRVPPRESSDGVSLLALFTAGLAAIFGVTALGFSLRHQGTGTSVSTQTNQKATVAEVWLSDFKIQSDLSSFPAGPIKLTLVNKGTSKHNLAIDGIGSSAMLAPGEKSTFDLGVLEAGTYKWHCTVAGHEDAGMKGTFTVTGSSEGTSTGGKTPAAGSASVVGQPALGAAPDYAKVDTAHQEVVKAFLAGPPAKTEGLGGQPLVPTVESGMKVFDLTAKVVQWEVAPGKTFEAWTYNGTVPGPELRVKQGETVKVRIKNDLPESTSIHFHGLEIADNKQDGVTFVTQDPIKPGQTYKYVLTPLNCGSHMYHSHHAADAQVPLGLLGAFIVDCTTTPSPAFAAHDSEYTEILTDGPLGFGINGKGFPATAPVVAKVNEKTLIRFMNEGLIIHPMHLHGHRMTVIAKDGNFLPAPYDVDTINVAPGERYDVVVTSKYPGAWAFHCHILSHAESDEGLHGMTTVWVVKP
jgi:manganese oxidase